MQAQKENVDSNAAGTASKLHLAGQDKLSTSNSGFAIHEDSKPTGRKDQKDRCSNKRRVLGDISNKQRDSQRSNNSSGIPSVKEGRLREDLGQSKKISAKKKAKASLEAKAVTSLKPKTGIKPRRAAEVPDIELAYGGLVSPKLDSVYVESLHDEIVQDVLNDKTPTLFDDFDPARVVDDWSDEKAILESGDPPSAWWSKDSEKTELQEEVGEHDSVLDGVPPPDDLPDDLVLGSLDADELLGDVLSVDIEAVRTE